MKVDEIKNNLKKFILISDDVKKVYDTLVSMDVLQVSEETEKAVIIKLITINSLDDSFDARSVKVANIKFNLKKLFNENVGNIIGDVVGVLDGSVYAIIGCLAHTLHAVFAAMNIKIEKREAFVLCGLWECECVNTVVDLKKGYEQTNYILKSRQNRQISWDEFLDSVEKLESIECVKKVSDGEVQLIEEIKRRCRE